MSDRVSRSGVDAFFAKNAQRFSSCSIAPPEEAVHASTGKLNNALIESDGADKVFELYEAGFDAIDDSACTKFKDLDDAIEHDFTAPDDVPEAGSGGKSWFSRVGQGEVTNAKCGEYRGMKGCLHVERHDITGFDGDGHVVNYAGRPWERYFHSCDKPECPKCYKRGWAVMKRNVLRRNLTLLLMVMLILRALGMRLLVCFSTLLIVFHLVITV